MATLHPRNLRAPPDDDDVLDISSTSSRLSHSPPASPTSPTFAPPRQQPYSPGSLATSRGHPYSQSAWSTHSHSQHPHSISSPPVQVKSPPISIPSMYSSSKLSPLPLPSPLPSSGISSPSATRPGSFATTYRYGHTSHPQSRSSVPTPTSAVTARQLQLSLQVQQQMSASSSRSSSFAKMTRGLGVGLGLSFRHKSAGTTGGGGARSPLGKVDRYPDGHGHLEDHHPSIRRSRSRSRGGGAGYERERERGRSTSIVALGREARSPATSIIASNASPSSKKKKKKRKKKKGSASASESSSASEGEGEERWYSRYSGETYDSHSQARSQTQGAQSQLSLSAEGYSEVPAQNYNDSPAVGGGRQPPPGRSRGLSISSVSSSHRSQHHSHAYHQLPIGSKSQLNSGGFKSAGRGLGPGVGVKHDMGMSSTLSVGSMTATTTPVLNPLVINTKPSLGRMGYHHLATPTMTATATATTSTSMDTDDIIRGRKTRSSTISSFASSPSISSVSSVETATGVDVGGSTFKENSGGLGQQQQQLQQMPLSTSTSSTSLRSHTPTPGSYINFEGEDHEQSAMMTSSSTSVYVTATASLSTSSQASPASTSLSMVAGHGHGSNSSVDMGAIGGTGVDVGGGGGAQQGLRPGLRPRPRPKPSQLGLGLGLGLGQHQKDNEKGKERERQIQTRSSLASIFNTFGVPSFGFGSSSTGGGGGRDKGKGRAVESEVDREWEGEGGLEVVRDVPGADVEMEVDERQKGVHVADIGGGRQEEYEQKDGDVRHAAGAGVAAVVVDRRGGRSPTPSSQWSMDPNPDHRSGLNSGKPSRVQSPGLAHRPGQSQGTEQEPGQGQGQSQRQRQSPSHSESESRSTSLSSRRRWTAGTSKNRSRTPQSRGGSGSANASPSRDASWTGSVRISLGEIFQGRQTEEERGEPMDGARRGNEDEHDWDDEEEDEEEYEEEVDDDEITETRYHSVDDGGPDASGKKSDHVDAGATELGSTSGAGASAVATASNAVDEEDKKRTLTQMSYDYARGLVAYETITGTIRAHATGSSEAVAEGGGGGRQGGMRKGVIGTTRGAPTRARDSYYDSFYSTLITSPEKGSFGGARAGIVGVNPNLGMDRGMRALTGEAEGLEEEEEGGEPRHPYLVQTTIEDEIRHTHPDPGPSADVFYQGVHLPSTSQEQRERQDDDSHIPSRTSSRAESVVESRSHSTARLGDGHGHVTSRLTPSSSLSHLAASPAPSQTRSGSSGTSPHPYAYAYAYANREDDVEGEGDEDRRQEEKQGWSRRDGEVVKTAPSFDAGPKTAPPFAATTRIGINPTASSSMQYLGSVGGTIVIGSGPASMMRTAAEEQLQHQQSLPRITFSSAVGHVRGEGGTRREGLKNSMSTPNLRYPDAAASSSGHGHGGPGGEETARPAPARPAYQNASSSAQSSPRRPKRSPTDSAAGKSGKGDRWLTADTWCDALLMPRPKFRVKQNGHAYAMMMGMLGRERKASPGTDPLLSPAQTPIPPEELGGGEGTGTMKSKRSISIASRVLAHSRSLIELRNSGAAPGSVGIRWKGKEKERTVDRSATAYPSYLRGGQGVVPLDEAAVERELTTGATTEKTKPPRPRSFAQDDLSLPSPVPSLAQVLQEGQQLEDQRRKWQTQATNSFSNSLSRNVSRARSKSLTSQGQRQRHKLQQRNGPSAPPPPPVPELNLKNQGNFTYLAARSLLGNQDVTLVLTKPPRSRSRSRSRSRVRTLSHHDGTTIGHATVSTTAGSHSHAHSNSLSKTLSKSSRGTTTAASTGHATGSVAHSRQHSRNDSWGKTALHVAKSSVSLCGLGGNHDRGVVNIDNAQVDPEERKKVGLGVALDSTARRHEAKVLRIAELMKNHQHQQESDESGRRAGGIGVTASPVPSHLSDTRMGIAVSTPPPDNVLDRVPLSMPSHPYAQGGHSLSSPYRRHSPTHHHQRQGSDYVGPHPAQRPQSHEPIPEGPARHRLPPQITAQQHPYAVVKGNQDGGGNRDSYLPRFVIDEPRVDSNVPPPAKMWAQFAPGVVREILPRDIQYSPFIDTPDMDERKNRNHGGEMNNAMDGLGFTSDRLGEVFYLAHTKEKRASKDSGLGMMDDQPYSGTRQAAFVHDEGQVQRERPPSGYSNRAPVQFDASKQPHWDPRHRRYRSQLQDDDNTKSQARPGTSDSLNPNDGQEMLLQPPTALYTPTTDASSFDGSPPRVFGDPDDNLDHFQDLFYKPGSRSNPGHHGTSREAAANVEEHSRAVHLTGEEARDSVMSAGFALDMLANAPFARTSTRTPSGIPFDVNRRGSGLTSLARQIGEEIEMMNAESANSGYSSPRFGSIFSGRVSRSTGGSALAGHGSTIYSSGRRDGSDLEFVFAESPPSESGEPTDEVNNTITTFQPLVTLPEDVDLSRASSFMEGAEEDPTELLRVGLVESTSTPSIVATHRRESFTGQLSFIRTAKNDDEQGEGIADPPIRPRPRRATAEPSGSMSSPGKRSTGDQSLLPPSADPMRSSYMTISTAHSRISNLSDFPIPPLRDDLTINMSMTPGQISLLNSYFDEFSSPTPPNAEFMQHQDYPSPPSVSTLSLPPQAQPRPVSGRSLDQESNPRLTFGGSDADEVVAELVATLTKNGTRGFHS